MKIIESINELSADDLNLIARSIHIVIVDDISGSLCHTAALHSKLRFISEVYKIACHYGRSDYIRFCDAVTGYCIYNHAERNTLLSEMRSTRAMGGGSDVSCVAKFIDTWNEHNKPDLIILLSDMSIIGIESLSSLVGKDGNIIPSILVNVDA